MKELPLILTNRAQNRVNSIRKCAFLCDFHHNPWMVSLFAGKTVGGEHEYSIIGRFSWQALGSIQATRHIGLPTIHLKELEIPSSARSRHFPPLSSFSTDTGTPLTQHTPDTYL